MVRRDSDEMKSRIFTLTKGLAEARGEAKSLEALQKEMEGYQKETAALRKASADLQATLDSTRVDMQLLTGKVDDVRILAQKPSDDIALLKDDDAKRLASTEERLSRLEKGLVELQKTGAEIRQAQQQSQQTPENLYRQGVDAMKGEGGPAKSRELFSRFLELYPKHNLAPNVHYLLGETYYVEKNYEQAILQFQEVIQNFPVSEKVPSALLKQGMAFKELGDLKSAHFDFNKILKEHPQSEEAKLAKERLSAK